MAIITISRGSFSGGKTLAECLAVRLGYRCVSRETIVDAAKRYDIPEQKLVDALTKKPGFLERLTRERSHYMLCLRAALVREVMDEKVVYHGNAGHLLLKGAPHLIRVRVIASLDFRIGSLMNSQQMSRKDAVDYIEKVDSERSKWTKFLYQADWNDPALYDLVVNIDQIGITEACEVVSGVATLDQFKSTEASQKALRDLDLATEVRALLACNAVKNGVADAGIEIDAADGVVTISGTVSSSEDADKTQQVITAVPGVKQVNSQIEVWPHW